MIKNIVMSLVVLVAVGVSKAFAAGEPFVFISSAVTAAARTISVTNTQVTAIQIENLSTTGLVSYSLNGTTDTFKDVVNIPVLPSALSSYSIKILSLPAGATAQVRVIGGSR